MKIINYGIVGIGLVIGLLTALSAYNNSAASKIYSQAQAESMIIRASSQAQQVSASTMFPYFVLGVAALGVCLALIVLISLSDRRQALEERRIELLADQQVQVIERHYIETKTVLMIAPSTNRRDFYKALASVDKVKVLR